MSNSKLIELSYYDPSAQVRLSAYADTIVLDHNEKGEIRYCKRRKQSQHE